MSRPKIYSAMLVLFAIAFLSFSSLASNLVDDSKWKIYNLSPSGQTLSSKVVSSKEGVSFDFTTTPTTNYILATPDNPDFSNKNISVTYTIMGDGLFSNPNGGDGSPTARVYFQAANKGPFNPSNYWWSHAASAVLVNGGPLTISTSTNTDNLADWSDFYGHYASDPIYTDAFKAAVKNVGSVGLSFGGGSFFANGVGATSSTKMLLTDFVVSP